MKHSKILLLIKSIVYCSLSVTIIWQGALLYTKLAEKKAIESLDSVIVNVNGNVKKPGRYKVPEGTTHFEILQVAGVRTTSDLTPFNLTSQVESEQDVNVGELKTPVSINGDARLEFFLGEVSIISSEGRDRIVQEGMGIQEGDRILTEEKSQAELSLNTYSRIDMDNFAEITFDKIGVDDDGRNTIDIFQKTGVCWYKIAYTDKNEQCKTLTPLVNITVGAKGADFTVDVKYSETVVSVNDGLLLVERPDGSDIMNVITGQSVTIYNDGRPFSVSQISGEANVTDRFRALAKTKADIVMKHMPFNFIFYSMPNVFYFISVQFDQSTMHVVQLPPQTSISFFVQGFSTLQEAFLYGGPVFTSTLIERIMNTRIPKYAMFSKDDILRTALAIGGLKVSVDSKAASSMQLKQGRHTLTGQSIVSFLRPDISGDKDSERRQFEVLKSLFDQLRTKNIILTSLLSEQILTNIETNISSIETMKHYKNFISRKNWSFKSYNLPVTVRSEEGKNILEPNLEESRKLILN